MGITLGNRAAPASDAGASRGSKYQRGAPDEVPPARGRGRASAATESSRGRRAGRESSDEAPRGRRSRGADTEEAAPPRSAQRGWAGAKHVREETYDDIRFKLPEDDFALIAFMEDDPFDAAARHFLNGIQGQRAFICPGKKGPYPCALCKLGDRAMPWTFFNIIVFEGDDLLPVLKVWEAGPGYTKDIETQQDSRAVDGHLTSVYFEVRGKKAASGKGATKLEINPVRERDLKEEWNIDPLTQDEFDAFVKDMKGDGYVKFAPERALQEAADKLDKNSD